MMAFVFHVFVEGAKDASPAGVQRLAEAMAAHYGLAAADMLARLRSGRFRAKGNCDRATAEQYARDLDRLGARCTIEEATPQNSRPTPVPFAAVQPPEPARPSSSSLPPRTALPPRAATPAPLPAKPAQPAAKAEFSSGLSAAFSGEMPAASLGALEQLDSLALASVDGSEGSGPVAQPGGFEPPPEAAPAKKPDPAKADKPAKPARPRDEPLDLFVPPDLSTDDLQVELAPDERPARTSSQELRRPATPASGTEVSPAAPGPAPAAAAAAPAAPAPRRGHPLADPRMRLAAGVLIAILLGFLPAHVVAKLREKSAYAAIDHQVETLQQQATTAEAYAQLDARRAELLDEKYDERRSIAMLALLIWAAGGAGIAYLWFKRMPWERLSE